MFGVIGLATSQKPAAEDQQAGILAGAKRVRLARPGSPSKVIRLVVVAGALAVERSEGASQVLLL